jgi:hypothetical protein
MTDCIIKVGYMEIISNSGAFIPSLKTLMKLRRVENVKRQYTRLRRRR